MNIAKANEADLKMAMELSGAIDALSQGMFPQRGNEGQDEDGEVDFFDENDPQACVRAVQHLLRIARRGSLGRVVYGCAVMLDVRNKCVDPAEDVIAHHPHVLAHENALSARPLSAWTEEDGSVLWWKFPVNEPPYVGDPTDDNWPGYHTHWTPIVEPTELT